MNADKYLVGGLIKVLRKYLWDSGQLKISEESRIYREKFAKLKAQYFGQYIAMHEGEVVDHDADLSVLRQRIYQQYGHMPIMITLVEDVADPPLVRRDFRTETSDQL